MHRHAFTGYTVVLPDPPSGELSEEFPLSYRVADTLLTDASKLIPRTDPTPEYVAVAHLWWRARALLRDGILIFGSDASIATAFLERAMSELLLHVAMLTEPLRNAMEPGANPFERALSGLDVEDRVIDRLRAYLTWILDGEIRSLERTLSPRNLHLLFEPQTARDLARALEEHEREAPGLEKFVEGPDEILKDAEAEREKETFREDIRKQSRRVRRLYESPALDEWRQVIAQARSYVSLKDLLEKEPPRDSTITSAWEPAGLALGRISYDIASSLLHGSRLAPMRLFDNDAFAWWPGEGPEVANRLGSTARLASLYVFLLARTAAISDPGAEGSNR